MTSFYKDLWNERYAEAYDEAIDQGKSQTEADRRAILHAEGTAELLADHADYLRKARRENGE